MSLRRRSGWSFCTNDKGRHTDEAFAVETQQVSLTDTSQISHHSKLSNQNQNHLSRGKQNFQLEIFYRNWGHR